MAPTSHLLRELQGTLHPVRGVIQDSWYCKPRGFIAAAVGRETQDGASQVLEESPKAPSVLPPCDQHSGCSARTMLWRQEQKWFFIAP